MGQEIPRPLGLLAAPALLIVIGLYVVPLVLMLSLAFRDPVVGVENITWMFSTSAVGKIIWATLRFSVTAAVVATACGFLLAYVIWLGGRRLATGLMVVVLTSFWLSVLIRCFALILLLGNNGPVNATLKAMQLPAIQMMRNETGVLIGMVHYLIPFAVLTILSVLKDIDRQLLAAARGMGASRFRIFRSIVLPLAGPGIVAAFALTLVIALGFYITPALLGGGRVVMVAEFITFFIQNVLAWGKASALAILLIVGIALAYGLGKMVERLSLRRRAA